MSRGFYIFAFRKKINDLLPQGMTSVLSEYFTSLFSPNKKIYFTLSSFSFLEPTICSVSGGIVGLWYQPLPDVVKFTTSGSACLIR